jgi:hypothetical protein
MADSLGSSTTPEMVKRDVGEVCAAEFAPAGAFCALERVGLTTTKDNSNRKNA